MYDELYIYIRHTDSNNKNYTPNMRVSQCSFTSLKYKTRISEKTADTSASIYIAIVRVINLMFV